MRSALRPPIMVGPGIALNRNSPLANRLVAAWVPAVAPGIVGRGKAGGYIRDLALGNDAVITDLDFATAPLFGLGTVHDGTASDYAVAPALLSAYTAAGYLTVAAWIRPSAVSGNRQIFTLDPYFVTTRCWQFRLGGDKLNFIAFSSAGNAQATGATTLVAGSTYLCMGVFNGVTAKAYVNGIEDGTANLGGTANVPNSVPTIGQLVGGDETGPFTGTIGPVMWWKRGLSADEAWQLWHPATRWSLFTPPAPSRTYAVLGAAPPVVGGSRSWATIIGG